ncbi:PD-(D/E)XK nuclease family transposase [uncultured Blautia sp.]|uniref:coiled-coil domain-containing protein n=2 Tax=Blautia TaxID=572511 RepID=UPI00082284E7|nr:PD-(D/E)XK nuclease family transposase [Blautia acetigignens]MCU6774011.1 PD-(D/E)XK nuclease family transposase [Blautia acetigignens]SCH24114.1 PD-(D/E)XK nuclease family transposase [uncultured Blautia sp.]
MENKLKQYFPIIQQIYFYGSIKGVYTIVLFEKSPVQFHKYPDVYTHYFCQKSNTGLEMNLLQNYVFIPLDIFSQTVHNNGIRNLLEAWLVFLSSDSPELMISLITEYPKFKVMYEHLYYICQNVERMMEMYSAELKILDRNTVQYMVDQMQEATNSLSAEVSMKQEALQSKEQQLEEAHQKIKELQQLLGK